MTMVKHTSITVTSADITALVDALQAIQTVEDMNTSYRHMPSVNLVVVDELTGEVTNEVRLRFRIDAISTEDEMIPVNCRTVPKKVAKPSETREFQKRVAKSTK